jgi:hypothetical protein
MIIFGLIVVGAQVVDQIQLKFESVSTEEVLDPLIYAEKLGNQNQIDSPLATDDSARVEEPVITPPNLKLVEDPFAAPGKPDLQIGSGGTIASSDIRAPQIGLALKGRQVGTKKALLGRYGGNALTEGAVDRGLAWLAKNQGKDGSWSLEGPYSDGGNAENESAATAMALLAFQGAGNTHQEGKFQQNVVRGWNWLLPQQDPDGCFFRRGEYNHRFYTHSQATIAVCELLGMTKDPKYKQPAEQAVRYCLKSQNPDGGSRYVPGLDADVSVTGWVVMALQSARMAGLEVPEEDLRHVERFLD